MGVLWSPGRLLGGGTALPGLLARATFSSSPATSPLPSQKTSLLGRPFPKGAVLQCSLRGAEKRGSFLQSPREVFCAVPSARAAPALAAAQGRA